MMCVFPISIASATAAEKAYQDDRGRTRVRPFPTDPKLSGQLVGFDQVG